MRDCSRFPKTKFGWKSQSLHMAEEWLSGLRPSLGKRVCRKAPQVQILSPPPCAGESECAERHHRFTPLQIRVLPPLQCIGNANMSLGRLATTHNKQKERRDALFVFKLLISYWPKISFSLLLVFGPTSP